MNITKTIKILAVASVISLGSLTAYATPSDSSVEEYIRLMKLDENFINDTKEGFIGGYMSSATTKLEQNLPDLNDDKKAQVLALFEQEAKVLADEFVSDEALKTQSLAIIKQAVKKHLNQEQIDALNDFYRTPIGQQTVDIQNTMAKNILMPIMTNAMQKIQEIQQQPQFIKRQATLEAKIAEIVFD